MDLKDARKLSQETQEALRLRAIKAILDGMKIAEVVNLFGISRSAVNKWIALHKKSGTKSLLKKKRGRRSQDMRLLKPYQCAIIVNLITDRCRVMPKSCV